MSAFAESAKWERRDMQVRTRGSASLPSPAQSPVVSFPRPKHLATGHISPCRNPFAGIYVVQGKASGDCMDLACIANRCAPIIWPNASCAQQSARAKSHVVTKPKKAREPGKSSLRWPPPAPSVPPASSPPPSPAQLRSKRAKHIHEKSGLALPTAESPKTI